jgi:Mg2+-importing ATPase
MWRPADIPRYWARSAESLMTELSTQPEGLSTREGSRRKAVIGENSLAREQRARPIWLLARRFTSPLVLILVCGALISLVARDWPDAIIVLSIVAVSSLLGFSQEYRATLAIKRLQERLALKVNCRRDGEPVRMDARRLVPGDIVLLAAGNLIPADGVVLEAVDFLVTQAALTGESMPVEKQPAPSAPDASLPERRNVLYLGTSVRSGTAAMLVVRTGRQTEFAAIAQRLESVEGESAFERGIRHFGYLLVRIMLVIVILVLFLNFGLGRPALESLMFSVALAVGLSPELLPAIISVTLSSGTRQLAKQGVIVRRLSAIENLGSIDVLCADKTGTLTRGEMELTAAVGHDGQESNDVFQIGWINSILETGIENPLDRAMLEKAQFRNMPAPPMAKIDEIPYDFQRKRLTIVVADSNEAETHRLLTKGAFAEVLACCSALGAGGQERPLGTDDTVRLAEIFKGYGRQGSRVLAVATKRCPARARYTREDETAMTFEGFLVFADPLKKNIRKTVSGLKARGVALKIITGDNRHVAAHVAAAVGLDPASMLTGQDLSTARDEALWHLAENCDFFAEVDPQQKELIVRALQARGHVVGYMGDGINDAPALHAADVGISVEGAVDVARESADIVLLKSDLEVLQDGISSGRRTFANTLKYVYITTSANFGNMISMALAALFVPFLPLVPKQILLNNFLSDIPALALPTDSVDPEILAEPLKWDIGRVRTVMLIFGLVSTLFDLATFALLLLVFHAGETEFRTSWFVMSLLTEVAVIFILRTRARAWTRRPGWLLTISTVSVAGVGLLLPWSGRVASLFGFQPLPADLVALLLLLVGGYVLAAAIAKYVFYMLAGSAKR